MSAGISTERVFSLSAFEGVKLIRDYEVKLPGSSTAELIHAIEAHEGDGATLDLAAAAYLSAILDRNCVCVGEDFYRQCISAIVARHVPIWAKAMRQGRIRFLGSLSDDERDVFRAAGLSAANPSDEIVRWWDSVGGLSRHSIDAAKMAQGREAERMSLRLESERLASIGVSRKPEWKGLDDNFAGYDILSYEFGENGLVNKLIEVKSTSISPMRFIVTRNEWDQAAKAGSAYEFHIWNLAFNPPKLFVRTVAEIESHIPVDSGKGRWSTTSVPVG